MIKKEFKKISIALDPEILKKLEAGKYNRSKLIDSLLSDYFKTKKSKTRAVALSKARRFQNETRTCSTCAYKKRTGNGNIFFGKTHTPEVITYLKNIMNKKEVIMLSLDGEELLEFSSLHEAARQTKIHRGSISNCCKKIPNYNTAGGFKWKFKHN